MSKAYSYNREDMKSIGKSFLLSMTGVAGAYITQGVVPEVALVLSVGSWSLDLVPLIAAGLPFVVNAIRLFRRGSKID